MTWRFADPWWLLALLLPLALFFFPRPRYSTLRFGAYVLLARSLRLSLMPGLLRGMWMAGLMLCILALARPQYGRVIIEREHSGRDLILLIDLSASMVADDMRNPAGDSVDRLETVFRAAEEFIAGRPSDRLGLSIFGSTALTVCPPTMDHSALLEMLRLVERQMRREWTETIGWHGIPTGGIVGPGTNTGLGIVDSLVHLQEDAALGRAIILLADGRDSRNLPNWVDPLLAAEQARRLGVRIHAIGVGDRNGDMTDWQLLHQLGQRRRIPLWPNFLPELERLQEMTDIAEGVSMHADTREDLQRIFAEIDLLEPSPQLVRQYEDYQDRFHLFLLAGIILLFLVLCAAPRHLLARFQP